MATGVTEQTIAKGFDDFMDNIRNGLFGDQVTVTTPYDKCTTSFTVTIRPDTGNHSEGEFVFEIVMECSSRLQIYCRTAIYHPNIDTTKGDGEVCIDLEPDCSAQDVVEKLLDLMHEPDFFSSHLEMQSASDMADFWDDVKTSIAGGRVGHYLFPVNARYARLHPPANDEGESTEEHLEGMVLIEGNFGIKNYVLESALDEEDDDEE